MNDSPYDWPIAIVGAGAAGLMTAITAARSGARVLLLDSKARPGAKILMSGGTRCNLTNQSVSERDFQTNHPSVVRQILRAYPAEAAAQFFEDLGVHLTLEAGGKYFPTSHSAKTVLDALLREVDRLGIEFHRSRKVRSISHKGNVFCVAGDGFSYHANAVVITTGGLSFPTTGSDGAGYGFAEAFGHSIIATSPSLTPLLTDDRDWKDLSGVSLPVQLSLWENGKKRTQCDGSFLFTHTGFSGPAVLDISRHWIRRPREFDSKLVVDFRPGVNEQTCRSEWIKNASERPKQAAKNYLAHTLPLRLVQMILEKSNVEGGTTLNQLRRDDRERILKFIKHCELSVTGDLGYQKAEVTAGGVDLREVDPRILESKKQRGLFFAGEILDVDGRIGGFNFQWAWSSGFVAARGAIGAS